MGLIVERLLMSGIGYFNVSIDSLDEETFIELRKNGNFDFYKNNIKILAEEARRLDFRRLRVITVVVLQNLDQISYLIHKVHDLFPHVEHELRRPFGPYTYIAPKEMNWAERSFISDIEWKRLMDAVDAAGVPYSGSDKSDVHRTFFNERIM